MRVIVTYVTLVPRVVLAEVDTEIGRAGILGRSRRWRSEPGALLADAVVDVSLVVGAGNLEGSLTLTSK